MLVSCNRRTLFKPFCGSAMMDDNSSAATLYPPSTVQCPHPSAVWGDGPHLNCPMSLEVAHHLANGGSLGWSSEEIAA